LADANGKPLTRKRETVLPNLAKPASLERMQAPWTSPLPGRCAMSQRDHIRQTLIDLIENDVGQKFEDLHDDKKLREELGLDSVDVVSIVSQIERHFRIRLSQQELEHLVTVGDLLTLLEAKIDTPPAAAAA
jgi:acyl carrier protein